MKQCGRSVSATIGKLGPAAFRQFVLVAILAVGYLLPASSSFSAEMAAKTIAWRLRQGDQFRIRMTQRIRTEMLIGEKQSEVSMLSAMELHWRVVRTVPLAPGPGDAMHLEQTVKRLILQVTEADGQTSNYDSASPDAVPKPLEEVAATVRPLLNSRISIVLSPRGEIQSVQVPAETDSLLRGVPAYSRWKDLLTRDGIDRMLRQALGRMPAQPVSAGDVWEDTHEIDTPSGKITQANRYEYRGTVVENGRNLDVVQRTTTVRSGEQRGEFDEPPPRREQHDTGILHFDAAAGRLARSQNRHKVATESDWEGGRLRVSSTGTLDTAIEPIE